MIHVVLFRPEKPQNTGNIMRTCVAVHATLHIIGPLSFSLESKDLKRVGLDYIDDLKLFYYPTYEDFQRKNQGETIYYVTRYASQSYTMFDFTDPVKDYYVMFGRESTGIPHDILRNKPEFLLRIPMVPEARSLNVSNCVAVVIYEMLRQQKFLNLSTNEMIKGEDFLNKEIKLSNEK
ncbi:MAG: tRNA (cytidine(34)-2'-O)-methyltransferase [Bacilli bacterium]|nr:tRNA (cytidine(34)-2'-O)-methyltransferase [Bacilli bacterium]MDD3068698.1 tRNA (cytidine(34)-2'-O)-methyltransferase [Bacilli bacterium]MDD3841555.1 tRNA (cytidine(34)-2'-O)-methyltransferase [Bacilli bacterium]HKM10392.1 tRNA (cytidine(34)-2'-O)-methyltransferase [Bacilli bacterium]